MRTSRVFRLLFRIFIGLLILSVTVISILGGLSAILILSNYEETIQVDESPEINPVFDNATLRFTSMNFTLHFNITNNGYFDLDNLEVSVQLALNYSHIDGGMNATKIVPIFQNSTNFDTIPKGTTGIFHFFGSNSSFLFENFPDPLTEINWFRDPALEFYANFTISLDYTIGLHSLSITFTNMPVGVFSLL